MPFSQSQCKGGACMNKFMKRKTAMVIMIALLLIMTSVVSFGGSDNQTQKSSAIRIMMNDTILGEDKYSFLDDGTAMISVREAAEQFKAYVVWDNQDKMVSIVKPEINMVFVKDVLQEDDGSLTLKGVGSSFDVAGFDKNVDIYYEFGPMKSDVWNYRIIVLDPEGKEISSTETFVDMIDEKGLMGEIYMEGLDFEETGNYQFVFQLGIEDEFVSVEDAIFTVID